MAAAPKPPVFSNVRLLVDDFARSFRFYRDVVGLRPAPGHGEPPYGEFVEGRRAWLGLFDRTLMAKALGRPIRTPGRGASAPFAIVLEVADVDAAARRLRRRGVPIVAGPADRELWGLRTVHFRDPDGNVIELYERLPKPRRAARRATRAAGP